MSDLIEAARNTLLAPDYVMTALAEADGPSIVELTEMIERLSRTGRERDVLMGLVAHARGAT
jgi:hypothetical protein